MCWSISACSSQARWCSRSLCCQPCWQRSRRLGIAIFCASCGRRCVLALVTTMATVVARLRSSRRPPITSQAQAGWPGGRRAHRHHPGEPYRSATSLAQAWQLLHLPADAVCRLHQSVLAWTITEPGVAAVLDFVFRARFAERPSSTASAFLSELAAPAVRCDATVPRDLDGVTLWPGGAIGDGDQFRYHPVVPSGVFSRQRCEPRRARGSLPLAASIVLLGVITGCGVALRPLLLPRRPAMRCCH